MPLLPEVLSLAEVAAKEQVKHLGLTSFACVQILGE